MPPDQCAVIVAALRRGEAVIAPTDTIYGLLCNALDGEAVNRVVALKGRAQDKPLPVAVQDLEQAGRVAASIPDAASLLAQRFWPGALTLVVPASPGLPTAVAPDGFVGVRAPGHAWLLSMLKEVGVPLVATSANLAGGAQPTGPAFIPGELLRKVAVFVDQGILPAGLPSTVVDVSSTPPRMLREGAIARRDIEVAAGLTIL